MFGKTQNPKTHAWVYSPMSFALPKSWAQKSSMIFRVQKFIALYSAVLHCYCCCFCIRGWRTITTCLNMLLFDVWVVFTSFMLEWFFGGVSVSAWICMRISSVRFVCHIRTRVYSLRKAQWINFEDDFPNTDNNISKWTDYNFWNFHVQYTELNIL